VMLGFVRRLFAKTAPAISTPLERLSLDQLVARFDSASSNSTNRNHWANADALAAVSAMTPGIRRTLRIRSRYEHDNNAYMQGAISAVVSDVVGRGPRPQVLTDDRELNTAIEQAWSAWSRASNLPDKLRILDTSRRVDGEGFAIFQTNRALLEFQPVALDLKLLEADQIADPNGWNPFTRPSGDDGIEVDSNGNPTRFGVLKSHPGDQRQITGQFDVEWIKAENVIQWFRPRRPGQLRGIPEMQAALPLFAQLRRFTLAVLSAAELAAMIAGILHTQSNVTIPEFTPAKGFQELEFARNMLLTLPAGYTVSQLKAEQPSTLYEMFVNVLLREIGRTLDMPFGIIAGDSSRYNYSSARLDHQTYELRRDTERDQLVIRVLSRCWRQFLYEARRAYRTPIWNRLGVIEELPVVWHCDARPSIDPLKDAKTDESRLTNHTITLAEIYAAKGMDWEEQLRQRAKERKLLDELGLPEAAVAAPVQADPTEDPTEEPAHAAA
jgi:lambda family phage portal protein